MRRSGFTLLELLLANVIVAVLLGGVLLMISALGRERRNLAAVGPDPAESVIKTLRWDLMNADTARSMAKGSGIVLVGHGGLDRSRLTPTSRRTRVIYQIRKKGNVTCLVREQSYLDDPARMEKWEEIVAVGVNLISIVGSQVDEEMVEMEESGAMAIPSSVRVQMEMGERLIDREIWLR